ncbi:LOW QUALITY PROTEIN: hypothetical protein ERFG_00567, partial [Escherichia coli TW10509]
RFIPAGAGNTSAPLRKCDPASVYPRWRGEHLPLNHPLFLPWGLSPLARGTPIASGFNFRNFRFIPAGAGNTLSRARNSAGYSVYPRWRGEHTKHT